jgi:hypothetical protein
MKFKVLKSTFISLVIALSFNTYAGLINLIEKDVYGNGTDKGYTLDIENYNLEWLDLDEVDMFSYNQVKDGLPQFNGWRIATKNEVFDLFENIFSTYDLMYQNTINYESITFDETTDSRLGETKSTFISIFDTIGGRLKYYDYGIQDHVRFSAFFDTGDTDVFGFFQLIGIESCNGVCSQLGLGVHTSRDKDSAEYFHERQAQHDSVMLVRAIDVPEPSTLAIFALGLMGLASRRFKEQS